MKRIRVIVRSGVDGQTHPKHGLLKGGTELEINVDQFADQLFKPKRKEDEKAIKNYLSSLEKKEVTN